MSNNPFENKPFQSPMNSGTGSATPGNPNAAAKVQGPATALMIISAIGMVLVVLGMLRNLTKMGAVAPAVEDPRLQIIAMTGVIGILVGILQLATGAFTIYGAMKMKNLESHSLAMAASIVAMFPCIAPCCLLGIPFGIWAVVTLNDAQVKASFR